MLLYRLIPDPGAAGLQMNFMSVEKLCPDQV